MTMFAVTQTQRFHAAVAGAGIANWQSYYGENSIDQWMTPFFGASVYDDPGGLCQELGHRLHPQREDAYPGGGRATATESVRRPSPSSSGMRCVPSTCPPSWWSTRTRVIVSTPPPIAATCWRAPCRGSSNTCRRTARLVTGLLPRGPVPSTLRTLTTHNSARASREVQMPAIGQIAQSRSNTTGESSRSRAGCVKQVR